MKKNRLELIDPKMIKYAHLAVLVDEDFELNKNPQIALRCTHRNYVVGTIGYLDDERMAFFDLYEPCYYEYFNNVTSAVNASANGKISKNEAFVIGASSLDSIGINTLLTKEELKCKLNKTGLEFKFEDEEKINKVPVKRRK